MVDTGGLDADPAPRTPSATQSSRTKDGKVCRRAEYIFEAEQRERLERPQGGGQNARTSRLEGAEAGEMIWSQDMEPRGERSNGTGWPRQTGRWAEGANDAGPIDGGASFLEKHGWAGTTVNGECCKAELQQSPCGDGTLSRADSRQPKADAVVGR